MAMKKLINETLDEDYGVLDKIMAEHKRQWPKKTPETINLLSLSEIHLEKTTRINFMILLQDICFM